MEKRKKGKQGSSDKASKSRKLEEDGRQVSDTSLDSKSFVAEVKKLLKNQETLLTGLTKLRDALKRNGGTGFNVFVEFVKDNSECPEVYKPLDKGKLDQAPLELQMTLEVLEKLLLFTADNPSYAAVGMYHVRRILYHLKLLYFCLNPTGHFNMVKGALRLLVAMVAQGTSAAREVVAVFDFTLKAFGSLVNKKDIRNQDSIRSCYIKFALSFLMFGDDATIRHILDVKGFVSSIFKLLPSDPPHVIIMAVKALHEKVVKNLQVPKKTKVHFFTPYVLTQLTRLYNYNYDKEDHDDDDHIKELTQHILQDICCTFKYGICFANKSGMFAGRSNNPVLLRFLQSLPKNNHEPDIQQLVIRILTCCPDLVQPYLTNLKTTYEPRLSLPWLANINFVIKLYSALPLPSMLIQKANIELSESKVQPVLNTVFPIGLTRMNLNQGIQHSSLLVKNTSLILILLVLKRASDLLELCQREAPSFAELFRDVLIKALPDIKTVISLRQNLLASMDSSTVNNKDNLEGNEKMEDISSEQCRPKLLLSRVIQVMYGYQKVQPVILSSVAFDLGKLLPGRDDVLDDVFPPTVQYYTLQILLSLPPGGFKWYQQKSKRGASNMYSILKMLVKSDIPEVKSIGESLVVKFLRDEGILSEHSCEMQIWLKHLYSKIFCEDQESLLLFLDSVCHSVAMEPYTYTDIVMEMTSQARQSSGQQLPFLEDTVESLASVTFSPLVVKALMSHVEMVSSSSSNQYTVNQLGSIARYVNLVVQDVISMMVDPLPLLLTVRRFYGNIRWPSELTCLRNIHYSLFQYVCRWTGTPSKVSEEDEMIDADPEKILEPFYRDPDPSHQDLVEVLSCLNEVQICKEIVPLLQHCSSKFQGDISTLVDLLATTPYCLTGSGPINEALFPLLEKLPFTNLAWQVFGPLIISYDHRRAQASETVESIIADVVAHPGIQTLLIESLQREDTSRFPVLCNHLLYYLSVFISATRGTDCVILQEKHRLCDTDCVTFKRGHDFMSAFALVFQLIELMVDKVNKTFDNLSRNTLDKTEVQEQDFIPSERSCVTQTKDGLRDLYQALLGHPVFYTCFVHKWKSKDQDAILSSLTLCISSILRNIIDRVNKELIQPYMDVICNNAVMEINNMTQDKEFSSDGQALQLLQDIGVYCDQQSLSKTITALLELTLDKLVHQSQEPSLFCQVLLSLLNALESLTTVNATANQSSLFPDVTSTTLHVVSRSNQDSTTRHVICTSNQNSAVLSVSNFERLTELSMVSPSPELDDIIHKLIRKSPKFVMVLKPEFLDFCLDNVTSERISIATTLISSSVSLRRHFEQRCISSEKCLEMDDLVGLLPVAQCYLLLAMENTGSSLENEVVHSLVSKYWPLLWSWLLTSKSTECNPENQRCSVLELLVRLKANDSAHDLQDKLTELLHLVPEQPWDSCQLSIVGTVIKSLSNSLDYNTLAWRTISACMENVSTTLSSDSGNCSTVEMTLKLLLDISATNTDHLAKIGGTVPVIEGETWATFVKSCLKHNFNCITTLKCMTACIKPLYTTIQRKAVAKVFPLTVLYELILTHSRFLDVIMEDSKENSSHKEAVLSLVVAVAEMSPECCQESHLPVLFAAYTASLSKTDQTMLYLLHLYERAQVILSSYRPYLWGKAALDHHKVRKIQGPSLWQQPSTNEVLELLDESVLNRTALEFPLERKLRPRLQDVVNPSHYDPCFLIPLFCHLLSPNAEVNCRKFVERGGLGYTVAALSSRDEHMRKAASHVLSRYLTHLDACSFRERKQVHLLLVSFKNGISDVNTRVSSVITRFISRAAYVMLHPEHQMYFLLNRFLLQRAVMDLREVPLFYTLFNSSSLQHRYERVWILELLQEGLRDAQDYYVYKKRHVMELAMSYHDSQLSDQQSRKLVIGLISAALTIHSAAFDLARNYGIVGWIHSLGLVGERESVSSSLHLLHTLWFTIQHGKPGTCDVEDSGEEPNLKPLPPNLAHETLLVCKTFIKYFSFNKELKDVCLLFNLVSSVLRHVGNGSTQGSQLTNKELLCMVRLWSETFEESQALSLLMNEVGLTKEDHSTATTYENKEDTERKKKSLHQLIDVIVLHRPSYSEDSTDVILLACNFALEFSPHPSLKINGDATSCCRHLDVVTWFRSCLATSLSLQTMVLSQRAEHCLLRLLNLYGLTRHDLHLIQELNMIFMTLMSRVQHVKDDELGSSANQVAALLHNDVYNEVITSGLVEVIFPLYPSPVSDSGQEREVVDVLVTELLSVFLQDLWFGQPVPSHFLDLVVTNNNDVCKKLSSIFLNGSSKLQDLLQTRLH